MKIAIIGFSGSGKSTLAKKISAKYHYPVLHLDTIHFTSNWQKREIKEAQFVEKQFRQQKNWIIEGNYQRLNNEDRFAEADQILFLNFSRFRCFFQALERYFIHRNQQRDDLAQGTYDRLTLSFLWWILWEGRRRKWTSFYSRLHKQYPFKFRTFHHPQELLIYLRASNEH